MKEIWKSIKGYEVIYEISNLGRVKSLSRLIIKSKGSYVSKELILNPSISNSRLYVGLYSEEKIYKVQVSVLVAIAFLNHTPNGYKIVVDHIDNNPLNNRVDNLQLISARLNVSKDRKGTSKFTGVTWDKSRGKWICYINIGGKNKYLGRFDDELKASKAYQDNLKLVNG